MSKELDYDGLGFKCGIEIHQQLDTETKLFSNAENRAVNDQEADAKIQRNLRPVASEVGEVDTAAKYEYLKGTDFVYNIYAGTTSLVELDEEPPHPLNPDALSTVLDTALLMDCDVVDELHVMRKMVIDGSNTSGFQRTAIVGMNGTIETDHGTVGIEDIEIEEESAGIHTRKDGTAIFDLDRLGIPLIEIGTDASIQSPEHAQAVAKQIGTILRSTGRVKRGLGTIRQDVNVSIADGARVEIKGFQELALLDELVRNEVRRQKTLVEIKEQLTAAGIEDISTDPVDVTEVFDETDNTIIDRIIESDGAVIAFKLRGLEGLMNTELCGALTLGKELATYAKSQDVAGMMHTDEQIEKYQLEAEFEEICDRLEKTDGEVVVIMAEQAERVYHAADVVRERADKLPAEIPEETRTAEMDTTTRYARPLPGRARMYPETDIPPVVLDADDIAARKQDLPELLDAKEERYRDLVGDEYASQLVSGTRWPLFEQLRSEYDIEDRLLANVLLNIVGGLESRDDVDTTDMMDEHVAAAVRLLADETITKNHVADLLVAQLDHPETPVDELAADFGAVDDDEIRSVVQDVIEEKSEMIAEQGEHAQGALMGLVMDRLEGADGSDVSRILREELADVL